MKLRESQSKESLGNYNKHANSVGMVEETTLQAELETEKDGSLHTSRGERASTLTNCTV